MELASLIELARGDQPAEIVIRNARLVNVFTGEIHPADIALAGDRIVGIGPGYTAGQVIDVQGRFVCPGFIDAHVHVESAMVPPDEFARAVVARGTTTAVIDPHEIANVLGLAGVRYMRDAAKHHPFSVFVMMPSCVPATEMETAGAALGWADMAPLRFDPLVLGLGEVMNFHGVVHRDQAVLAKIRGFAGAVRDGHAPQLTGRDLVAYAAAGIGSDHECTTVAQMHERLRLGMVVFIREATTAHNLADLIVGLTPANSRRVCFCTDDRQPADLLDQGHIDFILRGAIAGGVDPITAIRMATLNPAEYFGLSDRGGIAPGKRADLVVFADLFDIRPEMVFCGGRRVARNGRVIDWPPSRRPTGLGCSMNVNWDKVSLAIPARGRRGRIIGIVPGELVTDHLVADLTIRDGMVVSDPENDVLKIAIIERHRATGNVGLGLVKGLGLKRGAIASSVAHDSHNIVVVGADDRAMLVAAHAVADMHGGMVAVDGERVVAALALPIAGLMSDQPIETVHERIQELLAAARQLGSPLHDPFMVMSFLALPVIPCLKITDKGLVDVDRYRIVSLFVPAA